MKKKLYQRALQYCLSMLIVVICGISNNAHAQNVVPELKTKITKVSFQDGNKTRHNGWTLSADADPDVYESQVPAGTSKTVRFFSDEDQVVFQVEGGKTYSFNINYAGKIYHTQIVGKTGPDTYDLKF